MKTCALALFATLLCGCATEQLQPSVASTFVASQSGIAASTKRLASSQSKPKKPKKVVSAPSKGAWLCIGKWSRIGSVLYKNPSDSLAKQGYQEITFLPGGTYVWEGWHWGVNFKKTGRYEMRGDGFFMKDEKMLWEKGGSVKNLMWTDGTSPRYSMDPPWGPALEVLGGGNWVYYQHLRYDWKKHKVVDDGYLQDGPPGP